MAARAVLPLTRDTLELLPARCRRCAFWELDPVAGGRAETAGAGAAEKEAWLSETLLSWGSCGRVITVDGAAAAYAVFAPPVRVPRSTAFATSPPGGDAVLLTTLYVRPAYRGTGLGRLLVQTVAKDLLQRDVHAVEAFGGRGPRDSCLVPADFLLAVGFRTVRAHPRHPRLRLDLRSTATWWADVEGALERWLGALGHGEGALRPV